MCALKVRGWNTPARRPQKEDNQVCQTTVVTAKPKVTQTWLYASSSLLQMGRE